MTNDWRIYALASAFFAGLVVIFAKAGMMNIPSNLATLIRTVVIMGFLILLIFIRKEWTSTLSFTSRDLIFLILSAVATGLSWVCYFQALQTGPAAGVAAVDKLSLIFAVVFSILFLGEHLSWLQWSGVVLMAGGALLVTIK